MKALNTLRLGMDFVLRWFCIILFALLVALVVFQVVARYIGGGGTAWTEAMGRTVFIWQGIIGAAYVIGENDDVAIDFLVRKFPAAIVRLLEVIAHSVVAFFAVWVMVMGGWAFASNKFDQTVELLPFTVGQLYLVLPISGVIITIYCLLHIVHALTREVKVVNEDEIDISTLQEEGI